MLEPPPLAESQILAKLRGGYGLAAEEITFLPLGADVNTAVYRAEAAGRSYFVKLRRGEFDPLTVHAPHYLHHRGVPHLIPPLPAASGALWTHLDGFTVILYPFIAGRNGHDLALSAPQWIALGETLRSLHEAALPPDLAARVVREDFGPSWRTMVRSFQTQATGRSFPDSAAAGLAALLRRHEDMISELLRRAERLAHVLLTKSLPLVLCHADIQAWNVLIAGDGSLYVVDWDTLLFAPKERDLMFINAGLGWAGEDTGTEILFYRGYGPAETDVTALAYYRYERILEDVVAYCQQLLLSDAGGTDREEALRQISGQFEPNNVIEAAYRSDRVDPAFYGDDAGHPCAAGRPRRY